MAEAGPVVLECVVEGQVDDVVHHEHDDHGEDEQRAFLVVVLEGRVHAQAYPHYDGQQDVNPARPGVLELLLELAIVGVLGAQLHQHDSDENADQADDQDQVVAPVESGIEGVVLPLQPRRERHVVEVEDDERYEALLEQNGAHRSCPFANSEPAYEVQDQAYEKLEKSKKQHHVEVVQEGTGQIQPLDVFWQQGRVRRYEIYVQSIERLELRERREI